MSVALILLPAALGYRPGRALEVLGDFELHQMALPDSPRALLPLLPARGPLRGPSMFGPALQTIEAKAERFGYEINFTRRERRHEARTGRRHGPGRSVPLAIRWEGKVYLVEGVPEQVVEDAMFPRLELTGTIWRRSRRRQPWEVPLQPEQHPWRTPALFPWGPR